MGTRVPINLNQTLTEEEYCKIGEIAIQNLKAYSNPSLWKQIDEYDQYDYDNNISTTIHKTRSPRLRVPERVYMIKTVMNEVPERLVKLILPWKRYRSEWDTAVHDLSIIASYPNDVYLVRELRIVNEANALHESINIWKVHHDDSGIFIGVCGATHGGFPLSRSMHRVHNYIYGYSLIELPGEVTQLSILQHTNFLFENNVPPGIDLEVPKILRNHLISLRHGHYLALKKERRRRRYTEAEQ